MYFGKQLTWLLPLKKKKKRVLEKAPEAEVPVFKYALIQIPWKVWTNELKSTFQKQTSEIGKC